MPSKENIPLVAVRCGMKIRAQRRERQLTQQVLAAKAGLSPQYVSNIEKGEVNPPLGTLEQIAAALGVRLSTLLEDETQTNLDGAELAPLVFGLVTDIHTAQTVLAATAPKLQRLGEISGIPVPSPDTPSPYSKTSGSGLHYFKLLDAFPDLRFAACA